MAAAVSTPSEAHQHEGLRRALAWLLEQPRRDAATLEQAARRFDLSPVDEEFLLAHFHAATPEAPERGN